MKLSALKNRWSNESWPGIVWLPPETIEPVGDFFVFLGPNVELRYHPDTLVKFRQREFVGVIIEAESIHDNQPEFPAPLGYPKFRDDFFVLKLGKYGAEFLAKWKETRDVSRTVWELGVKPCEYSPDLIRVHYDDTEAPQIVWGADE